eukprot:CAMPEP_0183340650 /NCGR_PEP_ID=MMETSP0164_2-20130417/7132_1 /TAXON_ID=221442 /ORGANISM="Coccolithus pelagicus ssp braarudi, Strain PLY182g" /LENGTH=305 /DNA_ID=CAMNT_0025510823 /DNA_START=26 /DNA_END=939 /DNA_ORIENTATION=+
MAPPVRSGLAVLCCGDRGPLTCMRGDDVPDDTWLLLDAFEDLNPALKPIRVGWCSEGARDMDASVVLPLGCWDYLDRIDEFRSCIQVLADSGVQPEADLRALLWASHKSYLLDLEAAGLPVVPTVVVCAGSCAEDITLACGELGRKCARAAIVGDETELLYKPALGTRGQGVVRLRLSAGCAAGAEDLLGLVATTDMLIQPWLPHVSVGGELCFVFVNEELLHVVHKSAAHWSKDKTTAAPPRTDVCSGAPSLGHPVQRLSAEDCAPQLTLARRALALVRQLGCSGSSLDSCLYLCRIDLLPNGT